MNIYILRTPEGVVLYCSEALGEGTGVDRPAFAAAKLLRATASTAVLCTYLTYAGPAQRTTDNA